MGDDYFLDLKKHYQLEREDEKYDAIPEIFQGKNIADYIDPEILQQLEELEREEELREGAGVYESEPEDEQTVRTRKIATEIRRRRSFLRKQSWLKKSRNAPVMPRSKGPAVRPSRPRARAAEKMDVAEKGESGDGECVCVYMGFHMQIFSPSRLSNSTCWAEEETIQVSSVSDGSLSLPGSLGFQSQVGGS